jgi:hypothetical protein
MTGQTMPDESKVRVEAGQPTWFAKLATGNWTPATDITLSYDHGRTYPGHVVWVSDDGTCAMVRNNNGEPPVCICDTVNHQMCPPSVWVHTDEDGWNLDESMLYGMDDSDWCRLADAGRLIIDGAAA